MKKWLETINRGRAIPQQIKLQLLRRIALEIVILVDNAKSFGIDLVETPKNPSIKFIRVFPQELSRVNSF